MTDVTVTSSSVSSVRVPGGRKKKSGNHHGFAGFMFTAPFMVLFLLLFIAPLAYALYLSLFREQLVGGNSFVGLDNYTDGLKDKQFIDGVKRVALFMVVQVPVMLILALAFALIIDSGKVVWAKLYRVGFFVPYAVPTVIAALMWGFLYGKDFGPFADIADAIGSAPPNFLGENLMLWSIANVSTWTYTGYNMIIFYAALRAIPGELYEAAAVDGASAFRTAIHIKLPLLRPAILLCGIFSVIGSSTPDFLSESTMLWSIANVQTWTYTGYNMIIFYAALRAIPAELYEAAAVDGASAFRTAIHIKLPLLRPAILLCGIFSVIGSFQLFAEPQIFASIAPEVIGKAYTPNLYVYNLAFADQQLNYAAALSFMLGLVVFVVSYLVMYASRRQEERG